MCCRASPGTGRTHIQVRVSRDERDFPRGLNTRMHHVPRPDPVLYILVLRSRYTQPRQSLQRSRIHIYIYMYVHTYAEQISLDELPANTPHHAVGPIRFNSTASLPLCLSFPPSSTVLSFFLFFFSPGLHLRPARSTYSLENDRSSVDFTRGGFSLDAASILPALSFPPPCFYAA